MNYKLKIEKVIVQKLVKNFRENNPILIIYSHLPQNTPSVIHIQVDLCCKFMRLVLLGTQNNMLAAIPNMGPRNITELDLITASKKSLNSPFSQFASVIPQFVG